MAVPTNTRQTVTQIVREDLIPKISIVDKLNTPLMSLLSTVNATSTKHEWTTDVLDVANAENAHVQGDDTVADLLTNEVRLDNRTQIFKRAISISGTSDAVNLVTSVKSSVKQAAKKLKEIKRDGEAAMVGVNRAKVVEMAAVAGKLASFQSWIISHTSFGTGGADPATADGTAIRTDGTQRALAEQQILDVLQQIGENTSEVPDTLLMSYFHANTVSQTFTGGNSRIESIEDKQLDTLIEVWVTPFGTMRIMKDAFLNSSTEDRRRDLFVLNTNFWRRAILRDMRTEPLAKTGDADRDQIVTEWTLEALNEKASGGVFDLTTS